MNICSNTQGALFVASCIKLQFCKVMRETTTQNAKIFTLLLVICFGLNGSLWVKYQPALFTKFFVVFCNIPCSDLGYSIQTVY